MSTITTDTLSLKKPQFNDEIAVTLQELGEAFQIIDDRMSEELSMSVTATDAMGTPTTIEYRRAGTNTLKKRAIASNPNSANKYQTVTVQYYDTAEVLKYAKTITLTYNTSGKVIGRTVV